MLPALPLMRAFARLRRLYGEHADLTRRIDELEAKFDQSFRVVFDAIRAMQTPTSTTRRPLGFAPAVAELFILCAKDARL